MFTISSPQLPLTLAPTFGGASIASIAIAEPNNFAPLTSVVTSINAIATEVSSFATFDGDSISIDVSNMGLTAISAIAIAGIQYTPAPDPDNIAPGQFFWDIYTNVIRVKTRSSSSISNTALYSPSQSANILLYAITDIPTDYVAPPYPSIFTFLPLDGTFSWGCSWEGQPSGSFSFTTYASLRTSVIQSLVPGTEFSAFNMGFRVNTISITEISATLNPSRLIQVSVTLGGRHENYLDRIVALMPPGQTGADDNLECSKSVSFNQFQASLFPENTTVAALAARSGTSFSGLSLVVDIPKGTPRNEGTTFISKATERVRQHGCFLRYSDYGSVRAIGLDAVPTHSFTEKDILSEVSSSISGKRVQQSFGSGFGQRQLGSILPPQLIESEAISISSENQSIYPYVHSYEPRYSISGRFESDVEQYETEKSQGNSSVSTKPEWKNRERVAQEVPDGDPHPEIPPANTGALKDLSNNFSASGVTKTFKLTKTLDGLPISDYLQRWGFAFLALDMYSNDGKSIPGATNAWQIIEEKTTTYLYDSQTGYQLGSDTVGWELTRFEEETGIETIALNSGRPKDNIKQQLYRYFRLPYRKSDRVFLEALRSYYKDLGSPPVEVYPVCLPNGKIEYRAAYDPTYIEPFFASTTTTHENSFKAIPDPDSTTRKPLPPKTTGKESFFRKSITVLNSKSTTTNAATTGNLFASSDDKGEDAYNEYTSQFSSQDAGFSNSAENTNFTRQPDRPPIATALPSVSERVEPELPEGKVTSPELFNYFAKTSHNPFYNSGGGIQGSGGQQSAISGGSLNYQSAKTRDEAEKAATTEITIQNMKDCLQETLTIPFRPQIREGDRLSYVCNGTQRQRRVLSISHEVTFAGLLKGSPIVTSNGTKATLGLERKTSVSFIKEKEPKPITESENNYNLKLFFAPDTHPMGEIQDPDMPTRRNFTIEG